MREAYHGGPSHFHNLPSRGLQRRLFSHHTSAVRRHCHADKGEAVIMPGKSRRLMDVPEQFVGWACDSLGLWADDLGRAACGNDNSIWDHVVGLIDWWSGMYMESDEEWSFPVLGRV